MKFFFFQSNNQSWGDLQAKVSETLVYHLGSKKDFSVSFENDKTPKQLRGYYRICGVLAPYMAEASVKDMKLLIGRLYEMGAAYGAKGYELTSEEKKAMNEYYKIKE